MGQEAACEARFGGRISVGKALLETDALIFRGAFRLSIPLGGIQTAEAADGLLRVTSPEGTAVFELGAQAEKWAHKIRNPRSLADKLDVKPGIRVSLCGAFDASFREQLNARTSDIREGKPAKDSDLIFLRAEGAKDLARLTPLQASLKRNGGIWVVYPKGRKDITESDVLQAGSQSGMVDTKIARFSDTHTAHKFVIPLARR
jgi:hypothetical protein